MTSGKMERVRRIRRILLLVLLANWLVAAAKIVFGILGHSLGMVADGAHSGFDGGSNIVGLIAVTAAARDPDRDHPYGHRKFEVVGAAVIGMFLATAAWTIGEKAVHRFTTGEVPEASLIQFSVLVVTLLFNIFVSLYEARMGRRLRSRVLLADSEHTRSDILATLAVIASLVASRLGFPQADPAIALFIALYVAWMAVRLILSSAQVLADHAVLDPSEIEKIILSVDGVRSCHEIRTRGMEEAVFADLRIHIDGDVSLKGAHDVSHAVEDALRRAFPQISDVVIHIEPEGRHE